jgi:hypothetical protein
MIIQSVIRGMHGISPAHVQTILDAGIECNLSRNNGAIPYIDIPKLLSERNLEWQQDHYNDPDPAYAPTPNEEFRRHTPFISTTAGTIERRKGRNDTWRAFDMALRFATDGFKVDGYLFYCDLFVLGRPAVELQAFAEELRELNVRPRYSGYQIEGEILAKILIPPAQIERADFFDVARVNADLSAGIVPTPDPARSLKNSLYVHPSRYSNVRTVIA